jgi:hypothetical protein
LKRKENWKVKGNEKKRKIDNERKWKKRMKNSKIFHKNFLKISK